MNSILEQINSMGAAFVQFAFPVLVQSSVLIVILLLANFLLRNRVRAVFRYWLWMLVLVKLVLPPGLSSPVSLGHLLAGQLQSVKAVAITTDTAIVDVPQMEEPTFVEAGSTAPAPLPLPVAAEPDSLPADSAIPAVPVTWQGVVFLAWLAVVAAMALLLLQRAMFVYGLVAQAKKADGTMVDTFRSCCERMRVKGRVGLRLSANAASPAVCGLFRPVVLLPQNIAPNMGPGHLQAVLLHELAHIKRGDLWVNLVQTLLQIFYFYNPLLWLANAVIRRTREQAVDESVQVAMGERARQYPQTLVDVAKLASERPALSLRLIGVVESKSLLKERVKRMLSRPIPKSAKLGFVGVLVVVIAGAVLLPMAKAMSKPPAFVVKGTVTDAETGQPIAGAKVGDVERYAEGKQWTTTDADGNYSYKTWYEEHIIFAQANGYSSQEKPLTTKLFGKEKQRVINFALEAVAADTKERLQTLVEDFFKHNYRDITARKTIEWGEPAVDAKGNMSIRYKYEATIWDKDKIITDQLFVFDKAGKLISYDKISPFPVGSRQWMQERVEEFFKNNYRDITARKTLEWGGPRQNKDGSYSIHYKYEATIWDKDKIISDKLFTIDKNGKFVSVKDVEQVQKETDKSASPDFKATLPNGVTVELVGVCEFEQGKLKNHWKPDGTLLETSFYVKNRSDIRNKAFGFLIRTDKPFDFIKWGILGAVEHLGTSEVVGSSNEPTQLYENMQERLHLVKIENLFETEVQLSIGLPWIDVVKYDGKYVIGQSDERIRFIESYDSPDGVKVVFQSNFEDMEIRLDAPVKGSAKSIRTAQIKKATDTSGQKYDVAIFDNITLAQIQHFQLKIRPKMCLVEFKNVSLKPNFKTDVQVEVEKTKATEVTEKAENSKFQATLPNGVTVELVGVCQHPSEGKQWWRPDGSGIGQTTFQLSKASVQTPRNRQHYGFIAQVYGPGEPSINWQVPEGHETQFIRSPRDSSGSQVPGLKGFIAALPENRKTSTVNLGVTFAPWKTIATVKENSAVDIGFYYGAEYTIEQPVEKLVGRSISVKMTHTFDRSAYALRMVAVTKSGKTITSSVNSTGGQHLTKMEHHYMIPLAQIQEFQLQTRPYQWVTFKNVSLKPNFKTNVQVEIEKPTEEGQTQESGRQSSSQKLRSVKLILGREKIIFEGKELLKGLAELPFELMQVPDRENVVLEILVDLELKESDDWSGMKPVLAAWTKEYNFDHLEVVEIENPAVQIEAARADK